MGFSSFKLLYISTKDLSFNLIGCFRVLPPAQCLTLNGGLYLSNICDDRLIFYKISPDGNVINDEDSTFIISFDANCGCLIASFPDSGSPKNLKILLDSSLTLSTHPTSNSYFASISSLFFRESIVTKLKPTPPLFPSSLSLTNPTQNFVPRNLSQSTGFFVAPYGPHGLEILYVHLSIDDAHNHLYDSDCVANIQLKGLKVTGDPNVPADQLSFKIMVQNNLNPSEALTSDPRPIFLYDVETGRSKLLSIRERMGQIILWARGLGQINKHPPIWAPEWVGCSYILYKDSSGLDSRIRFTIVWDDEEYNSRHAMDFYHLPHGDIPSSHLQLLTTS